MSDNNKELIKIIWDIQNKLRNDEGCVNVIGFCGCINSCTTVSVRRLFAVL